MAGGNSHQRAMEKATTARTGIPTSEDKTKIHHEESRLETKKNPVFLWLAGIGFVSVLLGGFGVMPFYYWPGAFMCYAGFFLIFLDLFFEPLLKRRYGWKAILSIFILVLVVAFTRGFVWVSAPLDISGSWFKSDYPEGSTPIIGTNLEWMAGMTELRIDFHNPTSRDFDDVNLYINVNEGVMDIQQSTTVPCSRIDDVSLTFHDSMSNVYQRGPSHGTIRFRCDKLPHNAIAEFVLGVVNDADLWRMNIHTRDMKSLSRISDLFGPKIKPSFVQTKATYRAIYKPYTKTQVVNLDGY
jgi:hypothetical protein